MTAVEAHVEVSPSAAVRQDVIARSTAACSGVTTWLSANALPWTRTTSAISNGGRALRAVSVVHEGTSVGYREPLIFLFGALVGAVFFNGGSLSSGLSAAATSAVLTRV